MSFSNLSTELQNIVISNHEYFAKWFVLLSFISLSYYYIFVVWKEHEPTKYFSVAVFRMLGFSLSFIYLVMSPFLLILMHPGYTFWEFYRVPFIVYTIYLAIFFTLIFVDGVRYGALTLLKLAGLDLGDHNANEIARQIENNKHFMKLKKSKV